MRHVRVSSIVWIILTFLNERAHWSRSPAVAKSSTHLTPSCPMRHLTWSTIRLISRATRCTSGSTSNRRLNVGTKNNPGRFDCYARAEDDEPLFIELAPDGGLLLLP
jgi:hypothetical protein